MARLGDIATQNFPRRRPAAILLLADRSKAARDTAWQTAKMDLAQKDTLEKFICQL